jgi:hypothetical protein
MYERLIKEIKKTLYKTMGRSHLRYEQMESVVMDIERHLNNRPLTYVESDNGEEQVLTPNVIMWGQNSHTVEDIEIEGDEISKLHARLMLKRQQVWQRWKKEYVHSLMESHRVHRGVGRVPEVGEIVLLVGDEKNRGEWTKGKVERHIQGKDGVVRGVTLLHKGHYIHRPLTLICPLEIKAVEAVQPEQRQKETRQCDREVLERRRRQLVNGYV